MRLPPTVTAAMSIAMAFASGADTKTEAQSTREPVASWTRSRLAEAVESAITPLETVVLAIRYEQLRDVNAFSPRSAKPLLMKGTGKKVYRGDAKRWFMRDDGFTFRSGVAEPRPTTRISGFDGDVHYTGSPTRLTLAETGSRRSVQPRGLFWDTILTYPYLTRALQRETTAITFEGDDGGRPVVEMTATWGDEERPWHLVARFDTERSFLPLSQKLSYAGKPYADCTLSEIRNVKGTDHWYAGHVRTVFHQKALGIVEQDTRIDKFELPVRLGEDAFRFDPPIGADVVDRRSNLAWHKDPWWDEIMPWATANLRWPRYSFQALGDFESHCDPSMDGSAAPEIAASHWHGQNPGAWDRPGRRFSVLYFWGDASSLHDPHPRWMTELAELAKLVEPFGGEVIVIGGDDTQPQSLRATATELMNGLPIAIDETDDQNGVTHTAFQLQHYFSVLLVDDEAKVRLIGNQGKPLMEAIADVIGEDEMAAINAVVKADARMTRTDHDAIKKHWVQLRQKSNGTGVISGRVRPLRKATVKLMPGMKMLLGSNPGGYMLFHDRRAQKSIEIDQATGQYEFTGLPRGTYELSLVIDNETTEKVNVVLATDDDSAEQSFAGE